jgi:glucan-binding YG repeat protein
MFTFSKFCIQKAKTVYTKIKISIDNQFIKSYFCIQKCIQTTKMTTKTENIRIQPAGKVALEYLAKKHEKSQTHYVTDLLLFAKKYGMNIYLKSDEDVPSMVKNLEKRIIGFMKKREQDLLIPMDQRNTAMVDKLVYLIDSLQAMNVIDFAQKTHDEKQEQVKFKVDNPTPAGSENPTTKNEEKEKATLVTDQNQLTFQIEKAHKERDLYQSELTYLLNNISSGGILDGGSFKLNIPKRELLRIKNLLNDH